MPSCEEYLKQCLQRIDGIGEIAVRPMMGDYLIYIDDRVIAGIYDDRFMLTLCESSEKGLKNAQTVSPYVGGGNMLLVPEDTDQETLCSIIRDMINELPIPKACRRFSFR